MSIIHVGYSFVRIAVYEIFQVGQHGRGEPRDSSGHRAAPTPAPRWPTVRIAGRSRSIAVFGEFFGTEVRVFAVASGTAANSLALATFCPPWGTVLTHAEAHIERDECGAPEFFTGGAKLSLIGGAGAKILPADLLRAAHLVRAARAWRAAAHAVDHPGDGTRRDLHAAGNHARSRRLLTNTTWPCTWTAHASPTRWWPRKWTRPTSPGRRASTCCRLA